MTGDREGPSVHVQTVIVHSCLGCKWLDHRLVRAKRTGGSVYDNYCNHPEEEGRVSFIGGHTRTPSWCPVLQEREGKQDA
jgi:hypothetical protein